MPDRGSMGLFGMLPEEEILARLTERFGPMTQTTRAGRMNPELRAAQPTMLERIGRGVLDYGPIPAQIATEIAKQPVRAGEAVGEALHDPTLANVTNAGFQTAATVGRPLAALGALGLGYGEAARRDLGLFSTPEAAAEEQPPGIFGEQPAAPAQADPLANLYAQRASLDQQRAAARAEAEAQSRTGRGPRWQAAMEDVRRIEAEIAGLDRLISDEQKRNSPEFQLEMERKAKEQEEYDRAVQRAEAAREAEMSRDRRFSDTEFGKVYNETGGAGAPLAALGVGAMHGIARGGRGLWHGYAEPAAGGTVAALTANTMPLAFNAFATEPDNPERRALMAYARELPQGHPRKEEFMQYAEGLPEANPVREQAWGELRDDFWPRMGISALEGVTMGPLGAHLAGGARSGMGALFSSRGGAPTPPPATPQRQVVIEKKDKLGRTYRYEKGTGRRLPK